MEGLEFGELNDMDFDLDAKDGDWPQELETRFEKLDELYEFSDEPDRSEINDLFGVLDPMGGWQLVSQKAHGQSRAMGLLQKSVSSSTTIAEEPC